MADCEQFVNTILGEVLTDQLKHGSHEVLQSIFKLFDLFREEIELIFRGVRKLVVNYIEEEDDVNEELTAALRRFEYFSGFNVLNTSGLHRSIALLFGLNVDQAHVFRFFLLYYFYSRKSDYDDIIHESVRGLIEQQLVNQTEKQWLTQLLYVVSEMFKIEVHLYTLTDDQNTLLRYKPVSIVTQQILCLLELDKDGEQSIHPVIHGENQDFKKIRELCVMMEPRIFNFSDVVLSEVVALPSVTNPIGVAAEILAEDLDKSFVLMCMNEKHNYTVDELLKVGCSGRSKKIVNIHRLTLSKIRDGVWIEKNRGTPEQKFFAEFMGSKMMDDESRKLERNLSVTAAVEAAMMSEESGYNYATVSWPTKEIQHLRGMIARYCRGLHMISREENTMIGIQGSVLPLRMGFLHSNQVIFNHGPGVVELRLIGRKYAMKISANEKTCIKHIYLGRSMLEEVQIPSQVVQLPKYHILVTEAGSMFQLVFNDCAMISIRDFPLCDMTRLADYKAYFHDCNSCREEQFTQERVFTLINATVRRNSARNINVPVVDNEHISPFYQSLKQGHVLEKYIVMMEEPTTQTTPKSPPIQPSSHDDKSEESVKERGLEVDGQPARKLPECTTNSTIAQEPATHDPHLEIVGEESLKQTNSGLLPLPQPPSPPLPQPPSPPLSTEYDLREGTASLDETVSDGVGMEKDVGESIPGVVMVLDEVTGLFSIQDVPNKTGIVSTENDNQQCGEGENRILEGGTLKGQDLITEAATACESFGADEVILEKDDSCEEIVMVTPQSQASPGETTKLTIQNKITTLLPTRRMKTSCAKPALVDDLVGLDPFSMFRSRRRANRNYPEKKLVLPWDNKVKTATTSDGIQAVASLSSEPAACSSSRVLRKRPVTTVRMEESEEESTSGSVPKKKVGKRSKKKAGKYVCGRDAGSNGIGKCNCGKTFVYKQHLSRHYRRVQNGRRFACPICDKLFYENSDMRRHVHGNHLRKLWGCEHCGKKYNYRKDLLVHYKKHHRGRALPPYKKRNSLLDETN